MWKQTISGAAQRLARRTLLVWAGAALFLAVAGVAVWLVYAPPNFIPGSENGITENSFERLPPDGETLSVPDPTATPSVAVTRVVETEVERVVVREVEREADAVVVQTVVVEREVEVARETISPSPMRMVESEVQVEVTGAPSPDQSSGGWQAPTPVPQPVAPSGLLPEPDTVTFADYPRSGLVDAWDDAVSTFSLDTDRTSFQLALNWARSGYDIDPASVRAEEWVNAFEYGYADPTHSDRFGITADILPHPLRDGMHMARVAFQAPEVAKRAPVNVTLVLDASGSMADGNRVDIARTAAESIVQNLGEEDRISIVHFTTNVLRDLTVSRSSPSNHRVGWSISKLTPRDSTNVQAGLNAGVRLADAMRRDRPDALNYVFLMSDGVANVDATNPFAILESAYDADARNPLRLVTIGVGIANYNDVLLEQLAQHGNGWYRYLSDVDSARDLFAERRWRALTTPFADQTRAQVRWNPELVQRWRLIGYENRVTSDESFTQPLKKFAEIPSGAATTVFYELELTPAGLKARTRDTLGTVELRWVTPEDGHEDDQRALISRGSDRGASGSDALKFGAIVALASDLYSAVGDYLMSERQIRSGLDALGDRMTSIGGDFATSQAYHDFAYVLHHITGSLPEQTQSGYAR